MSTDAIIILAICSAPLWAILIGNLLGCCTTPRRLVPMPGCRGTDHRRTEREIARRLHVHFALRGKSGNSSAPPSRPQSLVPRTPTIGGQSFNHNNQPLNP